MEINHGQLPDDVGLTRMAEFLTSWQIAVGVIKMILLYNYNPLADTNMTFLFQDVAAEMFDKFRAEIEDEDLRDSAASIRSGIITLRVST